MFTLSDLKIYILSVPYTLPVQVVNKKLGLPHINFHAFRHTTATRLLEKNVHPKIVQRQLGHSDIRQTLEYSHISMDVQIEGVDKLDE